MIPKSFRPRLPSFKSEYPDYLFITRISNEYKKESEMSYYGYFIIVLGLVIGYGFYFYRRSLSQKAGGDEAYARVRLNKLFQLPESESVAAAWDAITVPKLSKGQKAVETI